MIIPLSGGIFCLQGDSSVWIATEGLGLIQSNYISGLFLEVPAAYAIAHNIRYVFAEKRFIVAGH